MTEINKPIRVLIVDDSNVIRQMLTKMLNSADDIEVIGTATDPFDAREKIKQLNPDVLTLDIEMPKMDGITFLKKIMSLRPMPVLMISTRTLKGAEVTLQALELGAVDYVSKPTAQRPGEGMDALRNEIISKVRITAQAKVKQPVIKSANAAPAANLTYQSSAQINNYNIIAVGASTGGVEALTSLITPLPDTLPPIVITQHMPLQFTSAFAERLNRLCRLTVVHAEHGMTLRSGHAYLAPGDKHLTVTKQGNMLMSRLSDDDPVSGHKPSVDVLFDSVAQSVGKNALGIILTGMGKDGANGLKKMRDAGAFTFGQDKNSCIVYGMPKAAFDIGGVCQQLSLDQLPQAIVKQLEGNT